MTQFFSYFLFAYFTINLFDQRVRFVIFPNLKFYICREFFFSNIITEIFKWI